MRLERYISLIIVVILFGAGCTAEREALFDETVWVEQAQTSLMPFKQGLMGALKAGMQEGPEAAIEACRLQAPTIGEAVQSDRVAMGRTSHKLRNPDNAPRDWVAPLLQSYVDAPGKQGPEVVRLSGGRVGYVEPIIMQAMCQTCHGTTVSPEVESLLATHYPNDEARGFAEGDFRGLFWVEFEGGSETEEQGG